MSKLPHRYNATLPSSHIFAAALDHALREGNVEAAEFFASAEILHAVMKGRDDDVRHLLERGAEVTETAILVTAGFDSRSTARMLYEHCSTQGCSLDIIVKMRQRATAASWVATAIIAEPEYTPADALALVAARIGRDCSGIVRSYYALLAVKKQSA